MATPHDARDLATTIARQRMLVRVRWLAALFGIGQILAYEMQEYPAGVREAALVTIVLFVAGNVALSVGAGRATTTAEARRLAVASLVLDGAVASAFTYLYAFDPVSAMFALLFLVPIEGAVHFQLRGAMWSWGGVGVLYVGRELYAVQFDNPFEWTSLTFRVGLLGLVALTVGLITRQLARESARSQQALAELQRIELWRTRLLGMLGHDLRSPLTAVQGLATIVAADAERLGPAEVRDLTQRIVTQSNRLLALAEDLLELARQEQDSLVLQRQRVALRPLAREAAESAGYADGTHLDLPEELVADVDPARFAQVLGNLIANGHRHGAPPVEVRGRRIADGVELSVRDHGPGVPAGMRSVLFEPFAHGGDEGSVGLGLWIVQHVVAAHGGTIGYRQADPGAAFDITIPDAPDLISDDERHEPSSGDPEATSR